MGRRARTEVGGQRSVKIWHEAEIDRIGQPGDGVSVVAFFAAEDAGFHTVQVNYI